MRVPELLARLRLPTQSPWSVADWERAYGSGGLDYLDGIDEMARYSVAAGYVERAGERRRILDVGCGTGVLRRHLPERTVGAYVGFDLSAEAIHQARRDAGDPAPGGRSAPDGAGAAGSVTFVQADAVTAELPPSDVVVLNEVLYALDDPPILLERIAGLLPPDGHLVVSMWRHRGDRRLWRLLDRRFVLEDRVRIANRASTLALRGWMVASYRVRSR